MAFDPDAYLAGQSTFDPDAYLATPTPTPTPTAVAETGDEDGFLAKINAALRKPSPEWLRAPEEATRENIMAMVPHDLPSYLKSILGPPAHAYDLGHSLAQGDVRGIPLVGRVPEIIEAEETPAFSKERYGTAERTLMDLGILAGMRGPKIEIPSRARPLVEMPPPPPPVTPVAEAIRNLPAEPTLADKIRQPPPAPVVAPEVPAGTGQVHLIEQIKPLVNPETGAFTRGGDYIRSVMEQAPNEQLIDFIRWSKTPETTPYVARFGADYAADALRQRNVPVDEIAWQIKNIKEPAPAQPITPPADEAGPVTKVQETSLELAPPETDAQMLARQKAEAEANAGLQRETEKKAKVKYGWEQKLTGTTGDIGQQELGGELGGNETLFGRAAPTQARAAEVPRTPIDVIAEPPPPPVPPQDVPFTPEGGGAAPRKTRMFSLQLQADTDLIQNLKDKIGNRTYEPIPNKITADQAVNLVDERPIPDVINAIQDEANGVPGHVRSAMGQIVIKRLNRAAESLGQAGKTADADIAMNQAVNLAEWMQEFGTRSGQTVQSFAMWSALTPEGKLISVTRKVRKARANHEHENPGEVGEITDALNLPTEAEKIAAFRKLFKTNKTARKVKPRIQKLIEAARTGKLTEQEFYDIASDRLGLPRYDPQTAAEIMRLALEIDKLPEGMPRDQAVFNLNRFIATKMGFRLSDLPMGVYYGNMLSGYNTHIVNALDTFLNVGSELSGMAIANPRSAMKIFRNSLKGFNEGRADALMALTRGRMLTNSRWMEMPRLMEVAKFGEKGGVPPLGKGLAGRIVTKLAESKAGYPLNAWKYVGRLMSASDSIMFRGAKEGRAALLADRLARDDGLRGKALNRRVQEELGRTTEQETLFGQQAKDEGFSGSARQARVNELRERSRSTEANADADDFAGIATYNHRPQGVLGYFANKVGEASESTKHPVLRTLRTVVPFTNIVANVTNRGLNYTPWGFKRAFRGYSGERPPKGDARRAMLVRATMGSTGLGLLYTLQQQGAVEIHGAGPSDPDKRKQLQEAGWRPYSIKMGDHYLSYLPTPLGLGLSILGNMSDVQRYGEMDQKSALLRGTYALTRVGSTIFSQSFLSSLSTLFEALSGQSPGQQLSAWRRLTSGITGTASTPRIVLDVQRIFDPKRYESNTIAGDLLKNTPFSAMVNRPILNAFGEPIEPPTNRFISAASDDPAWRAIAEANLRVPVPDKYTAMPDGRGGKRQITPEEYYEYLEKSGPLVKQYIMRDTFNLTHMPPDKAQDLLSKKSQEIRQRVLNEIRRRAQFTPAD